jgi:hypothetical protein
MTGADLNKNNSLCKAHWWIFPAVGDILLEIFLGQLNRA